MIHKVIKVVLKVLGMDFWEIVVKDVGFLKLEVDVVSAILYLGDYR